MLTCLLIFVGPRDAILCQHGCSTLEFSLVGAIGFDGDTELAWCMPRGQLSSLIQRQTLDANDDVYALAA